MNRPRHRLIEQLSSGLQPVRVMPPAALTTALWYACAWLAVVTVTLAVAPARPGAFGQLITSPHFLIESALGLVASVLVAGFAFADSTPGGVARSWLPVSLVVAALWALAFVVGLEFPALPPSMAGKRPYCFYETLLYGVPVAAVAVYLSRRYYVLATIRSSALLAMAGTMIPASFMQFACMYDPAHILTHHLLPIPIAVACFAGAAAFARR